MEKIVLTKLNFIELKFYGVGNGGGEEGKGGGATENKDDSSDIFSATSQAAMPCFHA